VTIDLDPVGTLDARTCDRSFEALYRHWERHQWSSLQVDYTVDTASFRRLDERAREDLLSIFAHFFVGEFEVARLLAPFLLAAPDYDVQLLLATQVADEHRHLQSILRVHDEVFGIVGGIDVVQAFTADRIEPVAVHLFSALEQVVRALETERDEDSFLRAMIGYHVLTEGSVARANQTLASRRFPLVGAFPGLVEAQRLAVRDELRHVGIGICYARRRLARDPVRARQVIGDLVDTFVQLGEYVVDQALSDTEGRLAGAYGLDPVTVWTEVQRQLRLRLRAIGLEAVGAA